jgi:hypothetical protein
MINKIKDRRIAKFEARMLENPLDISNHNLYKEFLQKDLYVVYFESANYPGNGSLCLVWALNEDDAFDHDSVMAYSEDFYRDKDSSKILGNLDEVIWAKVVTTNLVKGSRMEKLTFLYPIVN